MTYCRQNSDYGNISIVLERWVTLEVRLKDPECHGKASKWMSFKRWNRKGKHTPHQAFDGSGTQ